MRFLFVDRIVRLAPGEEVVVRKNVSNSEDFFADHFEGRPVMPGCLILETCDQAARLLLAASAEFACLPSLTEIANAKMQHFVQPGDLLEVHVVLVRQAVGEAQLRASASVGERTVARVSLGYHLRPAASDTQTARACARLREFYEVLTTDLATLTVDPRSAAEPPARTVRDA
jgi:3-hydroxyacyl-[acyl-carrier-protein] dehydratase